MYGPFACAGWLSTVALSLLILAPDVRAQAPSSTHLDTRVPKLELTVDSARYEVRALIGPIIHSAGPASAHHQHIPIPTVDFTWPIDGWVRGFRLDMTDANGQVVSKAVHHMHLVNYERRQLVYPIFERILAASGELDSAEVPKAVGIPVQAGHRFGAFLVLNHGLETPGPLYARLTVLWTPSTQLPRPHSIIPAVIDAHDVLASTYDLPAGASRKTFEFVVPIAGRVLFASGHLHDYGESLELQESATERTLLTIRANKTAGGQLSSMERKTFWPLENAPRLVPGVRYRLVASYNNTTGRALAASAMGMAVIAFYPDDLLAWPSLNWQDPMVQSDLRMLKGEPAIK